MSAAEAAGKNRNQLFGALLLNGAGTRWRTVPRRFCVRERAGYIGSMCALGRRTATATVSVLGGGGGGGGAAPHNFCGPYRFCSVTPSCARGC